MPMKKRRAKHRRAEVDPQIRAYLEDEMDHLFFFDSAEIAAAWQEIGAEIVEAWARAMPGVRPRMWWRRSAPEPGRQTNGGGGGKAPNRLEIPMTPPTPPRQVAFLRQHDLLLPGEARRLDADSTPEPIAE